MMYNVKNSIFIVINQKVVTLKYFTFGHISY